MSNVYFDIQIQGKNAGRVVFKLFDNIVPRTARNFRELATGKNGFGYQGSTFHSVKPGAEIVGGDITRGDGTGGKSIYGPRFEDENFKLKHNKPGTLSMANNGVCSNNSQFCIDIVSADWLNGHYVVFGEVIKGFEVIKAIEKLEIVSGPAKGKVKIAKCGTV